MVKTKTAVDQTNLNAVNQTPFLDVESEKDKDSEGQILKGKAVVMIDPTTGMAFTTSNPIHIQISDKTNPTTQVALDAILNQMSNPNGMIVKNVPFLYDPASTYFIYQRSPNVFKSALISAVGATAIWTSGVGKKWRLMGMQITIVSGTTAAAASLLTILDVAAATGLGVQICGAAMGAVASSTIIFNSSWGNGILAAATNTALNVNLSSALAVAGAWVQVWGTEE